MQMKNKLKSEKGVMTMYVTVAVITFTIILTALLSLAVATRRNQIKTIIKMKEVYEQNNSKKEQIYLAQKEKVELPSTGDTVPYYPDDTFIKDPDTDLDEGLVIRDKNKNEYVWIEVPKSLYNNEEYNTETTAEDQKPANSEDCDKIEYCLHKYTDYYRNGTDYKDEYSFDEALGLTKTQYDTLKQKMLKSVYENGGFWIGRYEAGITTNRTSNGEAITEAPLSKQGTVENPVYPYTYITCSQAQTIANMLTTSNYTSSLMFGVQWDLVMKHVEVKEVAKGIELATIQSALRTDSKDWGNYYNAGFEINRGKYAKEEDNGVLSSEWSNYNIALENHVTYENGVSTKVASEFESDTILLTTGASDACKKMNIYDLAGNVLEWTLEYTSNPLTPCTNRGGNYNNGSSVLPVASRYGISTNRVYSAGDGFRVSIFK